MEAAMPRRRRRYSARRIGLAPLPPRSPIRGMLVHCASMPRHRTKRIRLKEYTMAETPPTPNVPKSAIKAEPYTPPPKPAPPVKTPNSRSTSKTTEQGRN